MARRKSHLQQTFSAGQVQAFTMALIAGSPVEEAEQLAKLPKGTAQLAVARADVQSVLSRSGEALMLLTWAESVRQLEAHVRGGELAPALLLRIVQTLSAQMLAKAQLELSIDRSPQEQQAKLSDMLRRLVKAGGMEIVDVEDVSA